MHKEQILVGRTWNLLISLLYCRSSQSGLSQVLSPTNLFRPNKRTDRLVCLLCIFDLLARMVFRHLIYHILCTWIDWYVYMNRVSFKYYHIYISVAKRLVLSKGTYQKLKTILFDQRSTSRKTGRNRKKMKNGARKSGIIPCSNEQESWRFGFYGTLPERNMT